MGNYRPFLQGPLPVANYTRIIIPGRFWTRPHSTKSTRMASSATPLHDSLIELAIPDAHAHAIKWYLNNIIDNAVFVPILLNCHLFKKEFNNYLATITTKTIECMHARGQQRIANNLLSQCNASPPSTPLHRV